MRPAQIRRWLHVAGYALAGALTFYVLAPLGESPAAQFPPLPPEYRPWALAPWLIWLIAGGAVAGVGYLAAGPLGLRTTSARSLVLYPPAGVAVAGALGLVGVLGTGPGSLGPAARLGATDATACLVLAMAGALIARRARPPGPEGAPGGMPESGAASNWQMLADWASREDPTVRIDLLDRRAIVRRMTGQLLGSEGRLGHVALLGPYGSGKTTLLRLVEAELSRSTHGSRPWFCWVSCWGLERDSNPAVHILQEVIRTIDQHTEGAGLARIPDRYRRLLSSSTGWFAAALDFLDPPGDTEALVRKLDQPLDDADARVVVVIEDLDRDGEPVDAAQVQRLLWMLRRATRVSAVVAFDPQRLPAFDFAKVCDHIELIPALDADHVRKVLRMLQEHCLVGRQFIDPDGNRVREDRLDLGEPQGDLHIFARRITGHGTVNHIAAVLGTPRNLRVVVDRVTRAWARLVGEVDWSDLLVLNVLRVGSPAIYEFLVANRYRIRHREDRTFLPDAPQKLKEALKERLQTVERADSVEELVSFLRFEALSAVAGHPPPQGVGRLEPADYFTRAVTEEVDEPVRDQRVLADIRQWLQEHDDALAEGLVGPEGRAYAPVFEHLVGSVEPTRLQELTRRVVRRILARDAAAADGKAEGLLSLWRLCTRHLPRSPGAAEWVADLLSEAIPVSAAFADELYYFWASTRLGFMTEEGRIQSRRAVVGGMRRLVQSPRALVPVLDAKRPWALRNLVRPIDQDEPASVDREPAEWSWLGDALLGLLATADAETLREPIRWLVSVSDGDRLDRAAVEGIFSSGLDELLRWLSNVPPAQYEASSIPHAAAVWLAERGHPIASATPAEEDSRTECRPGPEEIA